MDSVNVETELADLIVPTEWEDKDNDLVAHARLFEAAGLPSKNELG